MKVNNVTDVAELVGKPMPKWLTDPAIWELFIKHWSTEEQRAKGVQNRENRMSAAGRPSGQCSKHAMGSKGVHARMFEEERATGEEASALRIVVEKNKKKDSDEVVDENKAIAFAQYLPMFHAKYGADKHPYEVPWDIPLWTQTDPVKPGVPKGRILGVGYTAAAAPLMEACSSRIASSSVVDELRRKCEEEAAKNKMLEEKMEEQKKVLEEQNKSLHEEMSGVKNDLASIKVFMQSFMAGAASGGMMGNMTQLLAAMQPQQAPLQPVVTQTPPPTAETQPPPQTAETQPSQTPLDPPRPSQIEPPQDNAE